MIVYEKSTLSKRSINWFCFINEGWRERDFEFARDADGYLPFEYIEKELDRFDLFHFGSETAFLDGQLKETYYKIKDYALKK